MASAPSYRAAREGSKLPKWVTLHGIISAEGDASEALLCCHSCLAGWAEGFTCSWRRSEADPLLAKPWPWVRPALLAAGGLPVPFAAPCAAMADQLAGWACVCCCCWLCCC